ncbi:hypothetical protein JX580_02985 [Thiomicrospira microaerophila]|uniref:hypothetical protein n=1 Tax=Thiomicrospira microaerophila TaxID=406020 RepID=UPI002010B001|nr:hypothetical protein [Thiomicrospira microaerophila]UQB42877.1 hypothetical protein JX580_02985 [Thiomicrospira microaerophila]
MSRQLVKYLTDQALPTPYVDTLAMARSENRTTLFPRIQAKVQQLAVIQGKNRPWKNKWKRLNHWRHWRL